MKQFHKQRAYETAFADAMLFCVIVYNWDQETSSRTSDMALAYDMTIEMGGEREGEGEEEEGRTRNS